MEQGNINIEEGKEYALTLKGSEVVLVHRLISELPYKDIAVTMHKIEAQLLKQITKEES